LNIHFYEKFVERVEVSQKNIKILCFILLVFLGPISLLINLYFLYLRVNPIFRVKSFIKRRKMKKKLSQMIEKELYRQMERANIQVND
jgi:hypothetical protein